MLHLFFLNKIKKLKDEKWAPDFGSAKFVPSWGGTVTGVRKFLIAYNINMLATKEQAHRWVQEKRFGVGYDNFL